MSDSSYTDAGSLKALFDYLWQRNVGLAENVLECLLTSLTTRERSLSVPPPWCLYLTESGSCPLVLETVAGRCDLDEVRVKVWSHHPPYGDNLAEYLAPRCKNSWFDIALTQLATDIREFNIIVDAPRYPKIDGIVEPPLSGRVHRKMDGIFVEVCYGELIPAERFGVRVPTDAERAVLRNEDKVPPEPAKPVPVKAQRQEQAAKRKARREAKKNSRITGAAEWAKGKPNLNYAEAREKPPSKKVDFYTECEKVVPDLTYNEFKAGLKIERDRRRAEAEAPARKS